jgi:hypothetical protein
VTTPLEPVKMNLGALREKSSDVQELQKKCCAEYSAAKGTDCRVAALRTFGNAVIWTI